VDLAAQPAAMEEPAPAAPRPDIRKLGDALRDDVRLRSFTVMGLFVLALFYTLHVARAFFLPIVFALLLDFLLSPAVRALRRLRVPTPVGAGVVVLALVGLLGLGVWQLAGPAQQWMAEAPRAVATVTAKLRSLHGPVEQVTRTAEQVEQATGVTPSADTPEVVLRGPSLTQRLFGTTTSLVAGLLEVIVLLFFLLAAGDLFLQKLVKVLPRTAGKRKAVQIARETEASVSTYLFTVALINLAEGIVVGVAMALLGMPNPALWGALIALLEFVPYIGAASFVAILTLASFATFDGVGRALLAPATFLLINFLQFNFVAPVVLGRRLTLNPVAVLVGVIFWWQLWGIPGVFVAVPLMATFKIFCDHIEPLAPVGEFLGK
jgi:predicted PurR-regulated permease PerM